jgi:tetratricopeptide (TPR) repeat protein
MDPLLKTKPSEHSRLKGSIFSTSTGNSQLPHMQINTADRQRDGIAALTMQRLAAVPLAWWVGVIVLGALAMRLIYIGQVVSTPIFLGLSMDSNLFDKLALHIIRGEWGHKDSIFLNEFYQFFLAGIYAVFGPNHLAVAVVQAVIDAASCGLLYFIAARCFGNAVGLVASLIYALYGIAIFYTGLILDTTATIFLQLSFLSLFIIGLDRYLPDSESFHTGAQRISLDPLNPRTLGPCPSSPRPLGLFFLLSSGLTFGLLLMARPNLTIFIALLPVYASFFLRKPFGRRRALGTLAVFGAGVAVVLLLCVWRHQAYFNAWTPFPAHGGLNFYIGNNPQADGMFMSPGGVSSNPVTQVKDAIRLASRESGRELGPYEASGYWLGKGLVYLVCQPLDAAALYLKKLMLFLRKEEVSLNINYSLSKELVPIFRIPFFGFGLVSPLGLLGLLIAAKHVSRNQALVLCYFAGCVLSIILFFISDRYRLPALPFAVIFAALAVIGICRVAARRERKTVIAGGMSAVLLFFLINYNFESISFRPLAAIHYNNLANLYIQIGEKEKALEELKRSLELNPGIAAAYNNLGQLQIEMGSPEEGERNLGLALEIDPDYAVAHYNMGMALDNRGDKKGALWHYRTAVHISPALVEARVNLAKMLFGAGDLTEARIHYQAALAEDPEFAEAYEGLAELYAKIGDYESAGFMFTQMIELGSAKYAAVVNAGLAFKMSGRMDVAFKYFKHATELDPKRPEAYLHVGSIYAEQGESERAITAFQKAITVAPKSYEAHLKVGIELAKRQDMESAVAAFQSAVSLHPERKEARMNLVKAHLIAGDPKAAFREYHELSVRNPEAAMELNSFFRLTPEF